MHCKSLWIKASAKRINVFSDGFKMILRTWAELKSVITYVWCLINVLHKLCQKSSSDKASFLFICNQGKIDNYTCTLFGVCDRTAIFRFRFGICSQIELVQTDKNKCKHMWCSQDIFLNRHSPINQSNAGRVTLVLAISFFLSPAQKSKGNDRFNGKTYWINHNDAK